MSTKIVIKTEETKESKVWGYFGRAYKGGEIIDPDYIYCKICSNDGIDTK